MCWCSVSIICAVVRITLHGAETICLFINILQTSFYYFESLFLQNRCIYSALNPTLRAVKRINGIQNKSFCFDNICLCTVLINFVLIHMYTYLRNILKCIKMFISLYIYLKYMRVCLCVY